ncbi:hypothetical protein WJX84_003109 [Apatococcus fuscideae]|uniref:Uncharacterized protein n=1 Tax=Apatococcus fuscideae TaxID=2026836 RepID=A0AAW1SRW0_9CHLO
MALEKINLLSKKEQQATSERGAHAPNVAQRGPGLSPSGRQAMQLVQEVKVQTLVNELHTLGLKGASLLDRQKATQQTVQAIHDACSLCARPDTQACFRPHPDFSKAAAGRNLDARAMVEGVLRGRCHLLMRVSQGPLASKSNPSELLLAPVEAYQATEASYLSELARLLPAGHGNATSAAEDQGAELVVELGLLFTLRMHANRGAMIQAQHNCLQNAGKIGRQQQLIIAQVLGKANLTEAQTAELLTVRERYMGGTRRILQQRQALWQAVEANLQDSSLESGPPQAERKVYAFEKVLELQRNMDEYHANFAWLVREWLLRLLTPIQVGVILAGCSTTDGMDDGPDKSVECIGICMLEVLAHQHNAAFFESVSEMLHSLSIPTP